MKKQDINDYLTCVFPIVGYVSYWSRVLDILSQFMRNYILPLPKE